MRRCELRLLIGFALFLQSIVVNAQAQNIVKAGTVSGTITVGGKSTEDAVVSVEGVSAAQKSKEPYYRRAIMTQRDLRFYPYVLPILVGSKVDFPNDDKVWHDVYSSSDTNKFNLGLYAPGKTNSVTFDKPGVVRVQCNVHPMMEAFIVVEESPYFSATEMGGNYHIAVPLGTYRLTVWHPTLGTRSEPFTLERPDEVLRLDIDLNQAQ